MSRMSRMSHQATIAKKAIQSDLFQEEMRKAAVKNQGALAFCETCKQWYPIASAPVVYHTNRNGRRVSCSFSCVLCKEKEEKEQMKKEEMERRAELVNKATPVQPKLSFADMAKR